MKKKLSVISSDSFDSDDMYVEDEAAKKPTGKGSGKDTGNSTTGWKSDSRKEDTKCKEKHAQQQLEDRIHWLEQENIKLQLQNSHLG